MRAVGCPRDAGPGAPQTLDASGAGARRRRRQPRPGRRRLDRHQRGARARRPQRGPHRRHGWLRRDPDDLAARRHLGDLRNPRSSRRRRECGCRLGADERRPRDGGRGQRPAARGKFTGTRGCGSRTGRRVSTPAPGDRDRPPGRRTALWTDSPHRVLRGAATRRRMERHRPRLREPRHFAHSPVAGVAPDGTVVAAWFLNSAGSDIVQAATRAGGGGFSGHRKLSGPTLGGYAPIVAVGRGGDALIGWTPSMGEAIYTVFRSRTGFYGPVLPAVVRDPAGRTSSTTSGCPTSGSTTRATPSRRGCATRSARCRPVTARATTSSKRPVWTPRARVWPP